MFTFLVWKHAVHLLVPKMLEHKGEGPMWHLPDIFIFRELPGCCLQQWGFAVGLWKATFGLAPAWVVKGLTWDPFRQQRDFNTGSFIWGWEMIIGDSISPIIWLFHLDYLHIGFYTTLPVALNFSRLSCIPSHNPLSTSSPDLILPFYPSAPPCLFYFPFLMISICSSWDRGSQPF